MAHRSPPRKVTYFEPVVPRLARKHHHRVHVRGRPPLSAARCVSIAAGLIPAR